ncbi:MAG: hypothetical protein AAB067_03005, partial [Planctomycetota bacterium]
NLMYRNFNAVVGRPFRVALLRVQTVARLKPCPTYKKSCRRPNSSVAQASRLLFFRCRRDACATYAIAVGDIIKLIHPPVFPSWEGCRGGLSYRVTIAHLIIIQTSKPA